MLTLSSGSTLRAQALVYQAEIELAALQLVGTGLLPLGPGWSAMETEVRISLSVALPSKGLLSAFDSGGNPVQVSSFFDVFFDLGLTDKDPLVNFGGVIVDGMTMTFPNNGPSNLAGFFSAALDPGVPGFGLFPPSEAFPMIGFFTEEVPLGVDLNGNGEMDKIKFTLAALSFLDANRTTTLVPDGTVVHDFNANMDLTGAVIDVSQDPPFGPVTLSGRGTVIASQVPEPGTTAAGLAVGLLAVASWRRKRR